MRLSTNSKRAASATILGILAVALALPSAFAANATSTFAVTATVQATCLIAATPMAFGTYTGLAATSSSTVSVTCTNTTPFNVDLSAGLATGATMTTRQMTGPASAVPGYALFADAARTKNWGQTVGTDTSAGADNGLANAITVYREVAAGQFVAPGANSDTITATITY